MVKELDIILLIGQRNYTEVVMADGESYLVARTLKNFSDSLSDRFWRAHKGTIVRSDAVQNIKWGSRPQLTMNNGLVVEASKTRLDELGLQA
jgi:DNA-binding LytR/AlgR family response regulator